MSICNLTCTILFSHHALRQGNKGPCLYTLNKWVLVLSSMQSVTITDWQANGRGLICVAECYGPGCDLDVEDQDKIGCRMDTQLYCVHTVHQQLCIVLSGVLLWLCTRPHGALRTCLLLVCILDAATQHDVKTRAVQAPLLSCLPKHQGLG